MHQLTPSQQKLGFRIHALSAVIGVVLALVINVWVGQPWWAHWVLLGLGIGVLSHWWFALGPGAGRPNA